MNYIDAIDNAIFAIQQYAELYSDIEYNTKKDIQRTFKVTQHTVKALNKLKEELKQ